MISVEDLRYFKLSLFERIEVTETIHPGDITQSRIDHMKFLREMLERVLATIERCENDQLVVLNDPTQETKDDSQQELKATRLYYKDTPGVGKEIYADISRNNQPIVQSEAIFGYEPWVQFEPKERDDILHQTYNQMVDAWNEQYGED